MCRLDKLSQREVFTSKHKRKGASPIIIIIYIYFCLLPGNDSNQLIQAVGLNNDSPGNLSQWCTVQESVLVARVAAQVSLVLVSCYPASYREPQAGLGNNGMFSTMSSLFPYVEQ